MATRSTIALEYADGTVDKVYCHWDGYLAYNGKILFEHYSDPFKLRDLIDQGDLSSLDREVGSKHDFDARVKGECTFYGRDRGETGVDARKFKDFADYEANHQYEEYSYILRTDGVWYVSTGDKFEPLMEAYIEELRQENEAEVE